MGEGDFDGGKYLAFSWEKWSVFLWVIGLLCYMTKKNDKIKSGKK